ncbi:leucine-rich repeat-containing protein 69 isoform X1 [Sapajus apella]|uniref:Leucine-rich repeat-containing protein 69 isoform X1 n=2 Tax=Sapajus apella TaxID=9515 RepID=A0A6J3FJ24_SAPAP|nr:leucine-rich repeat-containing protein 69 isoform X1 [Sapajus apella]XP_032105361.1 leucine-rich repeat-containing protein 69 isoform X1 [Sapajus apella]
MVTFFVFCFFSKIMTERLLIKALSGGKNTKIITLNGKKITKMPSALGKLPGLKTLALQNNLIPKVCPELCNLTQLTTLNLGNNLLEEVPEEMKYLVSLKNLHLAGNRICRFAPGACDGLQNLILLNLNNNHLTQLPQEVNRLKSLTHMSINFNQLASIPRELCFLKNLSELQLNYNELKCIPEEIKFLKKLQKLLLARNNIGVLPKELCDLKKLRILDIAGNIIRIFPSGFQDLKLREFYCEGNPLFLQWPEIAKQQENVWSLQEITSRFVINHPAENNPFLMDAMEWYPEIRRIISQRKTCAVCGQYFITTWLECVQFVPPPKAWKISKNLQLVPVRALVCSYKCFTQRDPNLFGIARV